MGDSRMKKLLLSFLAFLNALVTTTALACPPGGEPDTVDRIRYEVKDGEVWRDNVSKNERHLVPELKGAISIGYSKVNCTYNPKASDIRQRWRTSEEPTLLAWVDERGQVWVRGRIWDFLTDGDTVAEPRLIFNSQHKAIAIPNLSDAITVDAGESWIIVLRKDRTVWVWGWQSMFFIGARENGKPRPDLGARKLLGFPAYASVIAYNNAAYMLLADGQVTAWGDKHICVNVEQRIFQGFQFTCHVFGGPKEWIRRIWTSPEKPSECNAQLHNGEQWQWPCDDHNVTLGPESIRKISVSH